MHGIEGRRILNMSAGQRQAWNHAVIFTKNLILTPTPTWLETMKRCTELQLILCDSWCYVKFSHVLFTKLSNVAQGFFQATFFLFLFHLKFHTSYTCMWPPLSCSYSSLISIQCPSWPLVKVLHYNCIIYQLYYCFFLHKTI